MIKTDPLTSFLMAKFVSREEEKEYENTLLCALHKAHSFATRKLGREKTDELPDPAYDAAGDIIKRRLNEELEKAIAHLARTLALACEVGEKSTAKKRKKLKRMAEKAVVYEQIKLSMLENAFKMVDFDHIAEVLINVGERKTQVAAAVAAAGKEDAGKKPGAVKEGI